MQQCPLVYDLNCSWQLISIVVAIYQLFRIFVRIFFGVLVKKIIIEIFQAAACKEDILRGCAIFNFESPNFSLASTIEDLT